MRTAKVPTAARAGGVGRSPRRAAVGAGEVERFAHGTTVATNALLERQGRAHGVRRHRGLRAPAPPAPPDARAPLPALRRAARAARAARALPRRRASGSGRTACSCRSTWRRCPTLRRRGGRRLPALLVPRRVARARPWRPSCAAGYPGAHVVASHEVAPEFREYERASTTAADAYLGAASARATSRSLAERCREAGLPEPLVMRSSGGVATIDGGRRARRRSCSSRGRPAASSAPARVAALRRRRERDLVRHGRHLDRRLPDRGRPRRARRASASVGGLPIRLPMVDIHTVGAGGGSIVWRDARRRAARRAGERRRDPGPGLLRPRRRPADRHRREPPARPAARAGSPAGSSSTGRRPRAALDGTRPGRRSSRS